MEDLNVLSIIKLLPENNQQVEDFTRELNNFLDSGDVNPLDVLLCIKGFEKVMKNVKDNLNSLAVDELDKYTEKDIKYKSAKLSVSQSGVKYDYSKCNDFELMKYESTALKLKGDIKTRCNFLKGLKEALSTIDEETGEVIEIYPPAKISTTTAKVTLG